MGAKINRVQPSSAGVAQAENSLIRRSARVGEYNLGFEAGINLTVS
jgi:hypothetical protein